jgi:hypothetical protein
MAISKQNRTIWVLAAVIFLLLMALLLREKKTETVSPVNSPEEQFGDRVPPSSQSASAAELMPILNQISDCFHFSTRAETSVPFAIESILENFQSELGPISHQADRWMRWDLRGADGKIRRLRLEITENDEGQIGRELHVFSVDAQGTAAPQEIDPSLAVNPPDDRINQMLKEGEVFDKERAAVAFFPTGGRVEYVEKNATLSELEFFQGEKSFKCSDLKRPESCQCL